MSDVFPLVHRTEITALVARYRLPTVYPYRQFAEVGGLLSYGNDLRDNYRRAAWFGIAAPKSTSSEIVDKLNKQINEGLADPKMKARLADLGGVPMPMTPAEFGKFIVDETEKWGKVIRTANIKCD